MIDCESRATTVAETLIVVLVLSAKARPLKETVIAIIDIINPNFSLKFILVL